MNRADKVLGQIIELADESPSPLAGRAYPGLEREVAELLPIHNQLKRLPKEVAVSAAAKAALRAQLMANIREAAVEAQTRPGWRRAAAAVCSALSPAGFTSALARPAATALALVLSLGAAGATTVSAAMDSVPGDGLYPVKTAVEQTRLLVALTDEDRVSTHLWIATARVGELNKLIAVGRPDAVGKLAAEYETNVGHALAIAAASKQDKDALVAAVQQSVLQTYERAPGAVQAQLTPVVLKVGSAAEPAPAAISGGGTQAQEPPAAPPAGPVPTPGPAPEPTPLPTPTAPGGAVSVDKGEVTGGPGSGGKPAPVSGATAPVTPPDTEKLPPKAGDPGPATGPVPTKDQPPAPQPAEPKTDPAAEPVAPPATGGTIPEKTDPVAPPPSGGLDPKPQTTVVEPAGSFDPAKDGGQSPAPGPALGVKQ